MNRSGFRTWIWILGLIAGTALIVAAVFATQLGIDENADWGPSRWFMLQAGVAVAGLSAAFLAWRPVGRRLEPAADAIRSNPIAISVAKLQADAAACWRLRFSRHPRMLAFRGSGSTAVARLRAWPPVAWLLASTFRLAVLGTGVIAVGVLLIYVWIISVGRWDAWPKTTDHYNDLASAFLQGQLHLLIEPDSRLLELEDPYEREARESVTYIWDLVLYNGRYYLYWGPVPALLLAAVKLGLDITPGDQVLVLVSVAAAFLAGAWLILTLWRRFFSTLPWWTAGLPLIVLGLANPMPWLLNRPAVYEVAIGAGQFFLLAGTLFAITALYRGQPVRWRLAAAGMCWAAAVGSRASLAIVVIFLAAASALWITLRAEGRLRLRPDFRSLIALFLPLVVGAALLAGYNQARFADPLEFGHRYQLGRWNKTEQYQKVFSPAYLVPNLYNYLFNGFRTLSVFPFVKPTWGAHAIVQLHMTAPKPYHTEQITGLLVTTPFALYALASPILAWRATRRRSTKPAPGPADAEECNLLWTSLILAGGVVFAFAPLIVFVSVTQRHLADPIPLLMILASIGFWQSHKALLARPTLRRGHLLTAIVLMGYSALVGLLLGITSYQARFEHLNPALFERITRLLAF